jgi:hypothetical protein
MMKADDGSRRGREQINMYFIFRYKCSKEDCSI